jgi:hypothetical protein
MPNRDTYIPPHIQGAISGHVRQSMPPHLQKYRGGNTYIPQHAQAEMTQHLENTLPQHMKQYAGAYMDQHVVQPSLARRGQAAPPSPPPEHAVTPQASGVPTGLQSPAQAAPAQPGAVVSSPAAPASPDQPYDFITHPQQPVRQSGLAGIFSSSSLPVRVLLAAGGVLILLVLFVIIRGVLSSSPNLDAFVPVIQDQQELIHIVQGAGKGGEQQQSLTAANQNAAATIGASLTTSQSETLKYLAANKKKISQKQLNLKVSAATDKQLADAAAAGTYNQTFHDILEAKLAAYGSALDQAYKQGPGPKGKTLLTDSYKQFQLMQIQLKDTAN